jgi:cyanophycin synthetase
MIAAVLRARGVPDSAIEIIPDEQQAIDHALRLGRPGDLLLIFADALTRSWKQVIKFKPEVTAAPVAAPAAPAKPALPVDDGSELAQGAPIDLEAAGFVRDERGLRYVGEAED